MNAGTHQGYIKHLHRRQKETCILKTFVTLIRNKPKKVIVHIIAKKSPSSSTIILVTITLIIIITNTFVYIYIYIYIDECSEKIHVCEVNAKCTNTDGSHTALHGWIITGISNSLKFKELADHCIRIYFCSSRNCSCKEWLIDRSSVKNSLSIWATNCS